MISEVFARMVLKRPDDSYIRHRHWSEAFLFHAAQRPGSPLSETRQEFATMPGSQTSWRTTELTGSSSRLKSTTYIRHSILMDMLIRYIYDQYIFSQIFIIKINENF